MRAWRVLPIMHHPYGETPLNKRAVFSLEEQEPKDFPNKVQVLKIVETTATYFFKSPHRTDEPNGLFIQKWWPHFCLKSICTFFSQKLVPFLQFEIFICFLSGTA